MLLCENSSVSSEAMLVKEILHNTGQYIEGIWGDVGGGNFELCSQDYEPINRMFKTVCACDTKCGERDAGASALSPHACLGPRSQGPALCKACTTAWVLDSALCDWSKGHI